jgi:protein phosphatase 1 regulatory subunit 42
MAAACKITPPWLLDVVTKKQVGNVRDDVLKKLTHLNLEERNIQKIENLEVCEHLRVLYLFDNWIPRIENLNFAKDLTHLYLQNNRIAKIESMDSLLRLEKLYLDGNEIICIEGLAGLPRLQELSLSRQRPQITTAQFMDGAKGTTYHLPRSLPPQ